MEFWAIQLEVVYFNGDTPYIDVDFAKTEEEADEILHAFVERRAGPEFIKYIKGHALFAELPDRRVTAEAYKVTL